MKIGIYTPYLDTTGGGEKYILTIAEFLSQNENVEIVIDNHLASLGIQQIIEKNEKLHNLNLKNVKCIKAPIGQNSNFIKRLFFLSKYDFFFYHSDGSIFLSTAKNSIIHLQMPLDLAVNSLWGKVKQLSWKKAIYNSMFTKNYIEKQWSVKGEVIYPPVDIEIFSPMKKKKQILSVGRFSRAKKHLFMIDVFKKIVKNIKLTDISLHLAGGVSTGDREDIDQLKRMAKGYPIYFYPDIGLKDLTSLYGESLIYWHAMGYQEQDPGKMEHFGITTVEAMASGCVPIVINLGGQKEIVENEISGLLWDSTKQLMDMTLKVLSDKKLQKQISQQAVERSKMFSKKVFCQKINNIVYGSN